MGTVHAKFRVDGIDLRLGSQPKVGEDGRRIEDEAGRLVYESVALPTVRLSAVTGDEPGASDADAEENRSFWDATPQGACSLTITNGKAAEFFELGESYYLDFTRAS